MITPDIPQKILVAVAFTDDPLDADFRMVAGDLLVIEQATWLAKEVGAKITLLHVLEGVDYNLPHHSSTLHEVMKDRMVPLFEEKIKELTSQGIQVDYRIDEGVSSQRIITLAKLEHYHLVMTGISRNESFLESWMHGSTSRQLLRHCPTPVWVHSPRNSLSIDSIVVPVDFSETSEKTVRIANAIHQISGAKRYLVHCPSFTGLISARRMPNASEAVKEYKKEVVAKATQKIKELLKEEYSHWDYLISELPVEEAVAGIIQSKNIDVVLMGTVARTGLTGFFVGNTAERLLDNCTTSIWAIKPDDWKLA